MSKGALIFAHNNANMDYVKLAVFAAERIKKFLNVPVSIATDSKSWLLKTYPDHPFDQIIDIAVETSMSQQKKFHDGTMAFTLGEWKNLSRFRAYDVTPYDRTLVLDSDYIINSSILKIAFEKDAPFQIYKKSFDLAGWRDTKQFERINQYSVPFYWATVFAFDKTPVTQAFFDLVLYIKSNWLYFRTLYSIESTTFRNDYSFSIAIHLMNGKISGDFATELPGTMTYILDRDICLDIKDTTLKFLIEKKDHLGEYLAAKTSGIDVHVMNKASLSRIIDGGYGV
jgi:hypothetical protein